MRSTPKKVNWKLAHLIVHRVCLSFVFYTYLADHSVLKKNDLACIETASASRILSGAILFLRPYTAATAQPHCLLVAGLTYQTLFIIMALDRMAHTQPEPQNYNRRLSTVFQVSIVSPILSVHHRFFSWLTFTAYSGVLPA